MLLATDFRFSFRSFGRQELQDNGKRGQLQRILIGTSIIQVYLLKDYSAVKVKLRSLIHFIFRFSYPRA